MDNYGVPNGTPDGTPNETPVGTPNETPVGTPDETPVGTPNEIPIGTPNGMPNGAPNGMPNGTQNGIPYGTQHGIQNGGPNRGQYEKPMSLGDWLITIIVQMIPCVGIIMLFVWAFGEGNINRRNYCRASLIVTAVVVVLGVILYGAFAAFIFSVLGSYSYSY